VRFVTSWFEIVKCDVQNMSVTSDSRI